MPSTGVGKTESQSHAEGSRQLTGVRNGLWHRPSRPHHTTTHLQIQPGRYRAMDDVERKQNETLFTFPVDIPLQRSWSRSEAYWLQKDREMMTYLEQWPLSEWLIDPEEAMSAYEAMKDRMQLRQQGRSVYHNGVPRLMPAPNVPKPEQLQKMKTHVEDNPSTRTKEPQQSRKDKPLSSKPTPANKDETAPRRKPLITRLTLMRPKEPSNEVKQDAVAQDKADPAYKEPQRQVTSNERPFRRSQRGMPQIIEGDDSLLCTPSDNKIGSQNDQPTPRKKPRRMSSRVNNGTLEKPCDVLRHPIKELTPPPYIPNGTPKSKQPPDLPWESSEAADTPEEWDDSIYEPARLKHLEQVHTRNYPIVSAYMTGGRVNAEKRREAALAAGDAMKKAKLAPIAPVLPAMRPSHAKPKGRKPIEQREHFTGRLVFADDVNAAKFDKLPFPTLEDAIDHAMVDPFDDDFKSIEVTYDPGDSILNDLVLPRISLMDIARTRLQLQHLQIVTKRAAECIIDFCPDLLVGFRLMQVASETDFGNTSIQTRLGYNGSMLSDSTLTKRISAAVALEHNKTRALAAAAKDVGFFKEHRNNYTKYKTWRTWKRENSTPKPSTFSLADAASAFRAQQASIDGASKRSAVKKRPRKSDESVSLDSSVLSSGGDSRRASLMTVEAHGMNNTRRTRTASDRMLDEDLADQSRGNMLNCSEDAELSHSDEKVALARKDSHRPVLPAVSSDVVTGGNDKDDDKNDDDEDSVTRLASPDESAKLTGSRKRPRESHLKKGQSSLLNFFAVEPVAKRRSIRR